jgi:hypothetical protein
MWVCTIPVKGIIPFLRGWRVTNAKDYEIVKKLTLGYSMIRWGDGETANLRMKSTFHQKKNEELAKELNNLLEKALVEPNLMFGLPILGLRYPILGSNQFNFPLLKIYFSTRVLFNQKRFLQFKKSPVVDQMFWYKNYHRLSEILTILSFQERSVLFISSFDEKDFFRNCMDYTFVEVSPTDSFDNFRYLISQVSKWIENSPNRPLLLLAGGAASKVVGARFTKNCQVIDVGSGIRFGRIGGVKFDWEE